ncbi:MAG: cytochrome c [Telluria sp.]
MKKALLALVVAAVSSVAAAQVPAERAVKYRQSAYYLMGQNLSQMNLMLKGEVPFNKGSVEMNAETIALLGRLVAHAYPAGSVGGDSKAKPEVWSEGPKFRQLQQSSQLEADKLLAAAKSGDQQVLRLRFSDLSKSCKSCHDSYKSK